MQGWSPKLGDTLTSLELGRCAGVPASILVSVLSDLPQLKSLRLKGAPGTAILEILTFLPNLKSLDTDFIGPALSRYDDEPLASLRELTVRTSSVDVQGPQHLWPWIRKLVPRPSLESFTLHAFSPSGNTDIPRPFLLELALVHHETLKTFDVNTAQLIISDVKCLCSVFPGLETLSCSIPWSEPEPVVDALACGRRLRQVRLYTNWGSSLNQIGKGITQFDVEHARSLMIDSQSLRVIGIGRAMYLGKWVLSPQCDGGARQLEFQVERDYSPANW